MEDMINDRPPPPAGISLKAKLIFALVMVALLLGLGMYLKYPPLKQIGEVRFGDGAGIPVYLGALEWSDDLGVYQKRIFVRVPEAGKKMRMAGLAMSVCNMARDTRGVFGNRSRVAPNGEITVSFVQGGRYLFRFFPVEDLRMRYDSNSCIPAPYFAPPLEDWRIATVQLSEISGKTNLRLGLRWRGDGPMDAEGFPFKRVCEMILRSPPIQAKYALTEDVVTIEVSLERGLGVPLLNVYTWSGFRFQRVNELCLEIGPVEEA